MWEDIYHGEVIHHGIPDRRRPALHHARRHLRPRGRRIRQVHGGHRAAHLPEFPVRAAQRRQRPARHALQLHPHVQPHRGHRRAQDRRAGGRRRGAVLLLRHGGHLQRHFALRAGQQPRDSGGHLLRLHAGLYRHLSARALQRGLHASCSACRIWTPSPPWPGRRVSAR